MKEPIKIVQPGHKKPKCPTYNTDDFEVIDYQELEPQESGWKLAGQLVLRTGLAVGELTVLLLKSASAAMVNYIVHQRRRRYLSSIARQEPTYWRKAKRGSRATYKPATKSKRKVTITVEIEE